MEGFNNLYLKTRSTPMSEKPISPLRARMLEDMRVRNFGEPIQKDYIRHVKFLNIPWPLAGHRDARRSAPLSGASKQGGRATVDHQQRGFCTSVLLPGDA